VEFEILLTQPHFGLNPKWTRQTRQPLKVELVKRSRWVE